MNQFNQKLKDTNLLWKQFTDCGARQALQDEKKRSLSSDIEFIWEAIGPDGVLPNFDDSTFTAAGDVKPIEQLDELTRQRAAYDDYRALMIGKAWLEQDACQIGHILLTQMNEYAQSHVNEHVNDNWRDALAKWEEQ